MPNSPLVGLFIYHLSGSPLSPTPAPFEIILPKTVAADEQSGCQIWSHTAWTPSCDLVSTSSDATTCSCNEAGDYSTSAGAFVITTTTTTTTGALILPPYTGTILPPFSHQGPDDDDFDTGVIGFTIVASIIALLLLGILARLRSTKHPREESSEIKKPDIELGPVLKDKAKKKAFDAEGAGLSATDSSSGDESRLRKPTRKGRVITFIDPDEDSDAEESKASSSPSPPSSSDEEGAVPPQEGKGAKPAGSEKPHQAASPEKGKRPETEKHDDAERVAPLHSSSKSGSRSPSGSSKSASKSGRGSKSGSSSEGSRSSPGSE